MRRRPGRVDRPRPAPRTSARRAVTSRSHPGPHSRRRRSPRQTINQGTFNHAARAPGAAVRSFREVVASDPQNSDALSEPVLRAFPRRLSPPPPDAARPGAGAGSERSERSRRPAPVPGPGRSSGGRARRGLRRRDPAGRSLSGEASAQRPTLARRARPDRVGRGGALERRAGAPGRGPRFGLHDLESSAARASWTVGAGAASEGRLAAQRPFPDLRAAGRLLPAPRRTREAALASAPRDQGVDANPRSRAAAPQGLRGSRRDRRIALIKLDPGAAFGYALRAHARGSRGDRQGCSRT